MLEESWDTTARGVWNIATDKHDARTMGKQDQKLKSTAASDRKKKFYVKNRGEKKESKDGYVKGGDIPKESDRDDIKKGKP